MELPGTECQATCFKNSSYIFSKSGRKWYQNRHVCYKQGGDLVSIETQEEWQFISHEIQKRGTSNTSAWHIGLRKRDGDWTWTWSSGENLSISKWRDSQPDGNDSCAEMSKNGGLFNGISRYDKNAFICEMPGSKITFQP
ncbi:CD209 antigen-like protein D [Pocillopora verrucosa]|uniref:CD209 antigen-like protein D n=1 Tax=Pocillopora verrucosa TaxID=203993 RepID=UPI0033411E4B